MDIRGLECFYRAYETCSIGRTAEDMFVTRQAVSQTLQNLENEIHQKLFERSNLGLQPTAFARELYPLVMKLIENYRDIRELCFSSANITSSVKLALSLAVLESISVPSLMECIHQKCPNILMDVTTTEADISFACIIDGTKDVALIVDQFESKKISSRVLKKVPLCALLHESLLPPNPTHTIRDLAGLTWFCRTPSSHFEHKLREIFERESIPINLSYRYTDYHIVLEQAFNAEGVCAIPEEHAFRYESNNMVAIPLSEYGLSWDISLLTLRNAKSRSELLPVIKAIEEFFSEE